MAMSLLWRETRSVMGDPGVEYLQALSSSWFTTSRINSGSAKTSLELHSLTTAMLRSAENLEYCSTVSAITEQRSINSIQGLTCSCSKRAVRISRDVSRLSRAASD